MTLKIDPLEHDLQCPSCGATLLHHGKVEVFECSKDAKQGLHVTVADGLVTTNTNLTGNPSMRRNGLSIMFWCEGCSANPVLSIAQHKGSTLVEFK